GATRSEDTRRPSASERRRAPGWADVLPSPRSPPSSGRRSPVGLTAAGSGLFTIRGFALAADSFEEGGCRLIGRILIHEATLEGPLEDGLAEPGEAYLADGH